ncbi:DUF2750 domain-containing protein [Curtobacterium sp. SP.BCo]|uniref:DUF2750 domain-containing protein n=1 Tax=Curtobacterium sp. SP.BCo TaxID=3435229 RepID=UPI003F73E881
MVFPSSSLPRATTRGDRLFPGSDSRGRASEVWRRPRRPESVAELESTCWSRRSRAEEIIRPARAYEGSRPFEISLEHFGSRWLPGLQRDGILAGINCSGDDATGYDLTPDEVRARLSA